MPAFDISEKAPVKLRGEAYPQSRTQRSIIERFFADQVKNGVDLIEWVIRSFLVSGDASRAHPVRRVEPVLLHKSTASSVRCFIQSVISESGASVSNGRQFESVCQ